MRLDRMLVSSELLKPSFFHSRGQFVAARNLHLVLDSKHRKAEPHCVGSVAKQTDHGRMRAAQDSNDAAFSALHAGNATQTLNFCQNVVACMASWMASRGMKTSPSSCGIGESGRRSHSLRGEERGVLYFIAIRERRGLGMPRRLLARVFGRTPSVRLRLGRRYRPPGNSSMAPRFLSFESILTAGDCRLLQMEDPAQSRSRRGLASNLQKTQYVIGAEV